MIRRNFLKAAVASFLAALAVPTSLLAIDSNPFQPQIDYCLFHVTEDYIRKYELLACEGHEVLRDFVPVVYLPYLIDRGGNYEHCTVMYDVRKPFVMPVGLRQKTKQRLMIGGDPIFNSPILVWDSTEDSNNYNNYVLQQQEKLIIEYNMKTGFRNSSKPHLLGKNHLIKSQSFLCSYHANNT